MGPTGAHRVESEESCARMRKWPVCWFKSWSFYMEVSCQMCVNEDGLSCCLSQEDFVRCWFVWFDAGQSSWTSPGFSPAVSSLRSEGMAGESPKHGKNDSLFRHSYSHMQSLCSVSKQQFCACLKTAKGWHAAEEIHHLKNCYFTSLCCPNDKSTNYQKYILSFLCVYIWQPLTFLKKKTKKKSKNLTWFLLHSQQIHGIVLKHILKL